MQQGLAKPGGQWYQFRVIRDLNILQNQQVWD